MAICAIGSIGIGEYLSISIGIGRNIGIGAALLFMFDRQTCPNCSPSSEYLKHANCLKNVSTDTQMCGGHYQDLITSVDLKDNISPRDTIRMQCW